MCSIYFLLFTELLEIFLFVDVIVRSKGEKNFKINSDFKYQKVYKNQSFKMIKVKRESAGIERIIQKVEK